MNSEDKTNKQTTVGLIPKEWEVNHFSQILEEESLRNGLTKPTDVRGKGIKMVNMGELFQYDRISNIEAERVPLSDTEMKSYLLKSGDLLFARQSLLLSGVGKCSIFLKDAEAVTFEGHIIRARVDKNKGNPLFFYYFFLSNRGRKIIESYAEQVAAAGIRGSDLKKIPVPVPALPEQNAVSKILFDLDSKIENNQSMNRVIEAIGETVFKRWFVDFEFPNQDGKPYKSSGGEMVDSQIGKIPETWKTGRLMDVCEEITDGSHFSPKEDINGNRLIATVRDMDLFDFKVDTCKRISEEDYCKLVKAGCKPKINDILFSKDGTMGITFRYLSYQDLVLLSSIAIVRPKSNFISNYLFFYLRNNKTQERIFSGYVSGSALPRIVIKDIKRIEIIIPSDSLLRKFAEFYEPFYESIILNCQEIRTLSKIRDLLLPKLMTGKIRVPFENQEAK